MPDGYLLIRMDEVLKDALARELKRKDSLERRGFAVITSSGALASLIFAISAFVSQVHTIKNFSHDEALNIKISVVCFLGAAVLGVLINVPVRYGLLNAYSLWSTYEYWAADKRPDDAAHIDPAPAFHAAVVSAKNRVLERSQFWNWIKSELLLLAFLAEVAGILFITIAVFKVLTAELP
jgi:hypothetical protein